MAWPTATTSSNHGIDESGTRFRKSNYFPTSLMKSQTTVRHRGSGSNLFPIKPASSLDADS
jgi:hypothetical protein